jgi:hypothetical protein
MQYKKRDNTYTMEANTMKKVAAIVAILAIATTTAFAYPGAGYGKGKGMGKGQGRGQGPCVQQQGDPITDADAKAKIAEYLSTNLKGFEVTETIKVDKRKGTAYRFEVKDDNGNMFVLMVSPFGQVRGPMPVQVIK